MALNIIIIIILLYSELDISKMYEIFGMKSHNFYIFANYSVLKQFYCSASAKLSIMLSVLRLLFALIDSR